jgi:acyl carrier protein
VTDSVGEDRIADDLQRFWTAQLGFPVTDLDENLFHQGSRSIQLVRMLAHIEEAYDVALPVLLVYEDPSVRAIARLVRSRLPGD